MITREQAERLASEWIAAWNDHDLERILAHYTDDFTMSSPRIAVVAHEPSAQYLGEGFTLVERADAIEFESAGEARAMLERHASEPCFVTEAVAASAA